MAFDAANSAPPSRSYFQKTFCLQDWWLTKPQTDDDRKTLGVAGFTCTTQENRAGRCFSSAPIHKIYHFYELETVDGVCVILQGYINKDRTLENGFSSEVFEHFVIGFPPFWEEFSTSRPPKVSAAESIRANEEGKDSTEDSTLLQCDSYNVVMGVQDCGDTIMCNKTSSINDASSLENPREHIIKDANEVIHEMSPLRSQFEDDPSVMMSPMVINVHSTLHDVVRNNSVSKKSKKMAVGSSKVSKYLGVSSRRMTRSMTKIDQRKNKDYKVIDESLIGSESLDPLTSVIDRNDDIISSKTTMKDCQSKNKEGAKETITSPSKSNRKRTPGSPRGKMAKRQHITTPKSAHKDAGARILSPESFSGKKSRSGRTILPQMEYWRNQTAVYNVDRQITGVQEGIFVTQPLEVDISEDKKVSKKKDRRACKP